jgi:hypothetical protein
MGICAEDSGHFFRFTRKPTLRMPQSASTVFIVTSRSSVIDADQVIHW